MAAVEYMQLEEAQNSSNISDIEELSPEQIDSLLQRVEKRLKDAEELATTALNRSSGPKLPKIQAKSLPKPYIRSNGRIAQALNKSEIDDKKRKLAGKPKVLIDPIVEKQKKKEKAPTLAAWHGLPRTKLTPELKRDLQLLHMRSVLDRKRMYKKQGKLKIPEYSQVGTLVEGPTEFFSARINRRDRKQTLLEETLAAEADAGRIKRKYVEIQAKQASGKKGWYKAFRTRRVPAWKKR